MARYQPLTPDQMTAERQAVYDDIEKSRGSVRGPFPLMLHNAGLASATQELGGYARFESKIEPRLPFSAVLLRPCSSTRSRTSGEKSSSGTPSIVLERAASRGLTQIVRPCALARWLRSAMRSTCTP